MRRRWRGRGCYHHHGVLGLAFGCGLIFALLFSPRLLIILISIMLIIFANLLMRI